MLSGVRMVPLHDERPEGAVVAPHGVVCRVRTKFCLFSVIEEDKVIVNDLVGEPCSPKHGVQGVQVEQVGPHLDWPITGAVWV